MKVIKDRVKKALNSFLDGWGWLVFLLLWAICEYKGFSTEAAVYFTGFMLSSMVRRKE